MQCKGSVQDYYSILGVGKNADKSEIKSGEYL
jgi:DnaJ-class molecular chaperone